MKILLSSIHHRDSSLITFARNDTNQAPFLLLQALACASLCTLKGAAKLQASREF